MHALIKRGRCVPQTFLFIPSFKISNNCFSLNRCKSVMSSQSEPNNGPSFCLNNYDVIGFDLDHTICKYRLKAISELIYKNMCSYLVTRKNYPSDIFGSFEASARFYQRGLVIDIRKGNFLKVAEDLTILRATHGTRVMSSMQIEQKYGPDKIWDQTRNMLHELCESKGQPRPLKSLQDFFVIPAPYIAAKIIDYLDTKQRDDLEEYTFWMDILESISDMYRRECFKENTGGYFPALRENLPAYVEKCSEETVAWLKSLKCKKKLFLLTGSHYDYATFILDYIIGENWRELFDICVTYARKPGFFFESSEKRPFYRLDGFIETTVIPGNLLEANCVYSQGNWTELMDLFNRLCQTPNVKVLYFGDVIIDDVYAGQHYSCCHTVAVLEEMAAEDLVSQELNSDTWGSFFLDDGNDVAKYNYWVSVVKKYARLAIPSLGAMSSLPLTTVIPSFCQQPGSNNRGFYPDLPAIFFTCKMHSKI